MTIETSIALLSPKCLKQDEILSHQQCEDLISTLPKEREFSSPYVYNYRGHWFVDRHIRGVISFQKHFKAQDSDIFLVTFPKSGTTWTKAILFSLLNRTRYDPFSKDHPLLRKNPHELLQMMEIDLYSKNKIPDFSSLTSPRLFASHLPFECLPESVKNNTSCKIVYVCRNPKDVFVSLWHFENKLGRLETSIISEAFDKFCDGISRFGPWWDHILGYWKQSKENPNRVFFLKYEDMKANSRFLVRRLAEFVECPFSAEEEKSGMAEQILNLCSFENLSTLDVNKNGKTEKGLENRVFFRQGVAGDWKNHLDSQMVEKIDRITEHKFSGSGLTIM